MDLCRYCKYNLNGFCNFYKSKAVIVQGLSICTAYRKKIKKPIRNQIKKNSIKQEKKLAKDLGAKRTLQSGAQATSPADMIKGEYIIESKATNKSSIALKKEWLDQLKQSPINYGKVPVLVVEFVKSQERYIILDEKDFKKIIKENNYGICKSAKR